MPLKRKNSTASNLRCNCGSFIECKWHFYACPHDRRSSDPIFIKLADFYTDADKKKKAIKPFFEAMIREIQVLRSYSYSDYLSTRESMMEEIYKTSNSIMVLSENIHFKHHRGDFYKIGHYDFKSIYILSNSLIKSYLVFNYIFVQPSSTEESLVRFKQWEHLGFFEQPKGRKPGKGSLGKIINETIEQDIAKHISVIEGSLRRKLDRRKIKRLLSQPLPAFNSWNDLLKLSDLDYDIFTFAMAFFAMFEVGSFLSLKQLSRYRPTTTLKLDPTDNLQIQMCFGFIKVINALVYKHCEKEFVPYTMKFANKAYDKSFNSWINIGLKDKGKLKGFARKLQAT